MKRTFYKKMMIVYSVTLIIVFFLISLVYFQYNSTVKNRIIEQNISELLDVKKQHITLTLTSIENETFNLAEKYAQTFNAISDQEIIEFEHQDLQFYNGYFIDGDIEDDSSKFFVFADTIEEGSLLKDIVTLQKMQINFDSVLRRNPEIKCSYVITENNMVYNIPSLFIDVYDENHNLHEDIYYKKIVEEMKPVWIGPYYDYAGRGWVITFGCPIIIDGVLVGAAYNDLPIVFFQNEVISFSNTDFGYGFLTQSNGDIIYHPEYIGLDSEMGDSLGLNILQVGEEPIVDIMKREEIFFDNNTGYFKSDNGTQIFAFTGIDKLNWKLGLVIDQSSFLEDVFSGRPNYGLIIFVAMMMSAGLAVIIGYISAPVDQLSRRAVELLGDGIGRDKTSLQIINNAMSMLSEKNKQYLLEIMERNVQLESLIERLNDQIYIIDSDYTLKFPNISHQSKCYQYYYQQETVCEKCPVKSTLETMKADFVECSEGDRILNRYAYPVEAGTSLQIIVHKVDITDEVVLTRQLIQNEKLAGIGTITASIAHELRTPMSVTKGEVFLIKQIIESHELDKNVQLELLKSVSNIDRKITDTNRIINNLISYSKPTLDDEGEIQISAIADQILLLFNDIIRKKGISIKKDRLDNAVVRFNLDAFKMILTNLISNSIESIEKDGVIEIIFLEDHEGSKIMIRDNGIGIDSEEIDKVFKPFYSTKENGVGLGLWLIKKQVEKHSGNILLQSKKDLGTTAILTFASEK